jgi:hypothetical protein
VWYGKRPPTEFSKTNVALSCVSMVNPKRRCKTTIETATAGIAEGLPV